MRTLKFYARRMNVRKLVKALKQGFALTFHVGTWVSPDDFEIVFWNPHTGRYYVQYVEAWEGRAYVRPLDLPIREYLKGGPKEDLWGIHRVIDIEDFDIDEYNLLVG